MYTVMIQHNMELYTFLETEHECICFVIGWFQKCIFYNLFIE